ncbi:MAG: hypothetical protein SPD11_01025 [Sphaerochaetaceae bacterium]|nr:hypothetical protein [Sphaerochaetaceae bacterium]
MPDYMAKEDGRRSRRVDEDSIPIRLREQQRRPAGVIRASMAMGIGRQPRNEAAGQY